jgi:2-haloacid dehalogenase
VLAVFDVNETLLDLAGLDDWLEDLIGTTDARTEWFDALIHSALTVTAAGGYRQFGALAADCLLAVAARHGRTLDGDAAAGIGDRLRSLPAHPEVKASLQRLRDNGFRVATLTNSTLGVAEDQLRNAGLRDLVDAVYSADQAGRLKPAQVAYRSMLTAEHTEPGDAVLVAAHDWDIAGAAAAGMRTAFVARGHRMPLPGWKAPDVTGSDLAVVVERLVARQ